MLQNSVLFAHVLRYKYYCFCSLDEELGIKLETQRHPGMYTGVCWEVPPMGRIRAMGVWTKAANTQNFSLLLHSNLQRTVGTEQTHKQNIHCHQQLPAYSQQGREGTCRKTCEPSLNIIKHHWAAGSPPHFGSPSHDTCPFSLSIGFCDPVVEHNPLGRSPGISRQISPEKMKFVFADAP